MRQRRCLWGLIIMVALALPSLAFASIPEVKAITLKVGGRAVIGGLTGRCGHLPSRDAMKTVLTKTGHIAWGGVGESRKKACGGVTPAVEMLFVADRPGQETLTFGGRAISVRVTP